jgi:capsid protein
MITTKAKPTKRKPATKAARDQAALKAWQHRYAKLRASYDAARNSDEYRRIWENADGFDADSAHNKTVRQNLIKRARYEIGSNGYSDGAVQTKSIDIIGSAPALRMQTGSEIFNRLIETTWKLWSKATKFRRKLLCLAHAKISDGEAFAVIRNNPGLRHPVKIDLQLFEADQFTTPYLAYDDPDHIDGIKFDRFGNPVYYELAKQHPGASRAIGLDLTPERIDAASVLHWFKLRRPGQHRAVPEMASTLNVGAAGRRFREAVLGAAETAAEFTVLLHTTFTPDSEEIEYADEFSSREINKRMITALPLGFDATQLEAKHPNSTYDSFCDQLLNEQGRPLHMPLNKFKCNSAAYNYASGRLDHQTYYAALDTERDDCVDLVLDPFFEAWFASAVRRFGWLGGDPDIIGDGARAHLWDWPKHRIADRESEANATAKELTSGAKFITQVAAENGYDLADEVTSAAIFFGVSEDEIRGRLLDITLPAAPQAPAPPPAFGDTPEAALAPADQAAHAVFNRLRRPPPANGNGTGKNGRH